MVTIARIVHSLGGIAQKQHLVARGARDLDLTRAFRSGSVIRARQGWYSTLPEDDLRVRAVRVGGRLTGISAIEALGGWVVEHTVLHVSVPVNAARQRSPVNRFVPLRRRGDVELHWDPPELGDRGDFSSVALRDALRRVILDESFEQAIAALDWALHVGLMDDFDLELLLLTVPRELRHIRDWVDVTCESLPESLARTRLRIAGHNVETQVWLEETGEREDLVVDGQVGVDVDGREFHEPYFERDRRKDDVVNRAGLHAMRPSAAVVFRRWDGLQRAVAVALAARGFAPTSEIQGFGTPRRRRVPRLRATGPPVRQES
ncbi:glycyl-tRNA synthetase [Glaciihabitans arcticus]|uniref:glycyl-tRNA synthetase n=1 Tax=Glaciihabitans arcticus TaxID=2668039 RepID=UPI001875E310|nr:glycyl-tRNA synthetase [Glaciihabitans arcticus]